MLSVSASMRHLVVPTSLTSAGCRCRRLATAATPLPYRIRVPLAKLQQKKALPEDGFRAPALGDGEALETNAEFPDYVALALKARIYDHLQETPLQHMLALSQTTDAIVHLKREDTLPNFTFYSRCAINELAMLPSQAAAGGLVTGSVGSRGTALAWAAARLGMQLTVVMPTLTPLSRQEATKRLGATVVVHGDSMVESLAEARRLSETAGHMMVGGHDSPSVLAATGTVGLELLRQHGAASRRAASNGPCAPNATARPLDAVFVSVGGGSLLAGVAATLKSLSPHTRIIGVEPKSGPLLTNSLLSGHRDRLVGDRIASSEGLFVAQLAPEVFRLCDALVDDVITVEDAEISAAIRDTFLDTRAVLEPQGAVALAGLKQHASRHPRTTATTGATATDGTVRRPSYVALASDASNIEFEFLQRVGGASPHGDASIVSFGRGEGAGAAEPPKPR